MSKKRLDILLTQRGLAPGRAKAQALVMAGRVLVNEVPAQKPGTRTPETARIRIKGKQRQYVSRGGDKLAHALDYFNIDPTGAICMDVGASTGGFTDCLLKRGAGKVWAIDVGVNQLHHTLRADSRVVCLEKTNARNMDISLVTDPADILVADVAFISLKLVIPPLLPCLTQNGRLVLLIKPQFEAGREHVGKNGVVRDEKARDDVVADISAFFEDIGLVRLGTCQSPLKGPAGNIEYFIYLDSSDFHSEITKP